MREHFSRACTMHEFSAAASTFPDWAAPTSTAITLCRRSTEAGSSCGLTTWFPIARCDKEFPFVMVAHVSYPEITGDATPASLSKKWITGILRKKIGYRGLVISDDLDMGGVLNGASIEEAAVETLRAGSDLFLVCQKEEHVWRAYEAVFKRAESDARVRQAGSGESKTREPHSRRSQLSSGRG